MHKKKRVLIIGGGISGLSAAWYLKDAAETTLLEKAPRLGGWIATEKKDDATFEMGPRTFQVNKNQNLLQLIEELGLEEELIFSSPLLKSRFIFHNGQLQKVSPFSPIGRMMIFSLLQEWKVSKYSEDESVQSFAARRFGRNVAEQIFDPLTIGIYGGDFAKLSVQSCFGRLKALEREYGSVTKGFFRAPKVNIEHFPEKGKLLFSLKGGMQTIIAKLHEKMPSFLHLESNVQKISSSSKEVTVWTDTQKIHADMVVFATDSKTAARWMKSIDAVATDLLQSIPSLDLDLFHLGYKEKLSKKQGYGYLMPSKGRGNILGTIFDSDIFPSQNGCYSTRMTIFSRFPEGRVDERQVLKELGLHLNIKQAPDFIRHHHLKRALPQYYVGHTRKIQKIEKSLLRGAPRILLAGNYLEGVSVNDCIKRSKKVALDLLQR